MNAHAQSSKEGSHLPLLARRTWAALAAYFLVSSVCIIRELDYVPAQRKGILMQGLKNIMEDDVEYQLNQILPTMTDICSCEDCRLDMATYALNRLKPNYVRSDTGALFHKVNTSSTQAKTEILTAVVTAINVIGAHPHHKNAEGDNSEPAGETETAQDA